MTPIPLTAGRQRRDRARRTQGGLSELRTAAQSDGRSSNDPREEQGVGVGVGRGACREIEEEIRGRGTGFLLDPYLIRTRSNLTRIVPRSPA